MPERWAAWSKVRHPSNMPAASMHIMPCKADAALKLNMGRNKIWSRASGTRVPNIPRIVQMAPLAPIL